VNRARLEGELVGLRLPATKAQIVHWLRQHGGDVEAAQSLPEREYASANDVGEELQPVEPLPLVEPARPGTAQSGPPPGGAAYGSKPDK
jgi:Protein of unknown function (DUF2795)